MISTYFTFLGVIKNYVQDIKFRHDHHFWNLNYDKESFDMIPNSTRVLFEVIKTERKTEEKKFRETCDLHQEKAGSCYNSSVAFENTIL